MSILKRGAFAHNPHAKASLEQKTQADGYAAIKATCNSREVQCAALLGQIDNAVVELNKPISVSANEVDSLLTEVYTMADANNVEDSILTPIFMSVIDGAMRSFKVSAKLGLTPSRVYNECANFRYGKPAPISHGTDSYTEFKSEEFDKRDRQSMQVKENDGTSRDINSNDLRDKNAMDNYKDEYFNGEKVAADEYAPSETVYVNNDEAFDATGILRDGKAYHLESAETDHIIPCKVICEQLKKNKALELDDIKNITNCDDNLAVTSLKTNRRKGKKTNSKFIQENEENLSTEQKSAMIEAEKNAKKGVEKHQNAAVMKNLRTNRNIQKTFAKDAGTAALAQAGGEVILYILKPIYFEMKDSIQNGIEKGVSEKSFSEAIKVRFERVKKYILENSLSKVASNAFDFLKSFVSVLIEAIIGCLAGVFKMVWRLIKEGFKIVAGAAKILADKNKSLAEKGDAILRLAAVSISAAAGIYIDGAIKNLGIPEPWSTLLASVVSATVAAGILYLLNQLDVFNVKRDKRQKRILEILDEMNEQVALEAKIPLETTPYTYSIAM